MSYGPVLYELDDDAGFDRHADDALRIVAEDVAPVVVIDFTTRERVR